MTDAALSPQVLALAQALQALQLGGSTGYKAVPSSTPTTTYGHGNGGLLSAPGMSRDVINAMLLPHLGLQSLLPSYPSNEQNPLYGIVTGVTATSGSEPTGPCDDPPVAGLMKLCTQSYVFGRQSRMTRVFELDRVGLTTNRGEYSDFNLVGNPVQDNPNVPTMPGNASPAQALNNEIAKSNFELAVAWARDFGPRLYTGNPTNNTAGGGDKYYRGLDGLINTGYRDAETGSACAAADSIVASFNSANVASNGAGIVRAFTSIARRLRFNATEMGLMPTQWVIAMRWSAFYELTEIWPCAYLTYRCASVNSAGQPMTATVADYNSMRDQMRGDWDNRTGQYLLIDGVKWPVVIDDAIPETALSAGAFNSAVYFVPLTVIGGRRVTYMEYVDYTAPGGAMDMARAYAPEGAYMATDNGRFLWHKKPPTNFCVQALVKAEPRLILRTPQLAARLTNVAYTPLQHERDAFTTGYYFVNGGKTDRLGYGPSFFSETSSIG
jgi:hypothetical protein